MNKIFSLLLLSLVIISNPPEDKLTEKEHYSLYLNSHPYSLRPGMTKEDLKKIPKRDRPDLAWEQNFLATMDPSLGRPAPERLFPVYSQISNARKHAMTTPGAAASPWVERGPSNVSGRTRAIVFDPNASSGNKVWAGGVTGGLWYNNDITNSSSAWVAVNDFWDNIAISAIAFDPTNTNIMYVGTGESWGQSYSGARGAGIWKSTDGGASWTQLSSTTGFYYVNDLVVRNESGNGVVYAALRGYYYGQSWHGSSVQGVQRSTDGGATFSQVLPNVPGQSFNFAAADLEIGADNKLWVGTTTASYNGTDRGGGRILSSTNGTSWSTEFTHSGGQRVELACAPSDANYVYALIEGGNIVDTIVKTTNAGSSWTGVAQPNDADFNIPSNDFSRGQAWYDLIIAVDPNDRNTVIAGAIDLFRSANGGSSWTQLTHWYGGFGFPEVHADQHAIVFKPGSSSTVLFGNDGGVYYTANVAASSPSFAHRNNGYNVTQFYSCAIHPTSATDYFLAGAQDNGSQQFNGSGINSTVEVTGGDGAYCFIDQTSPNIQVTSYVYNSYWRSTDGGNSFGSRFQSDQSTGKFINPTDYDDNLHVLYSARTSSTINRVTDMNTSPTITNLSVSGMTNMASHLRVSPYTSSSTTLFVGTEGGDVFKITNAQAASPSSTSIGGNLPAGNISCIELGANEDEILVTYTNYGITSVWYTSNGGSSWFNKEGNLPDMPIRWALFNPNNRDEVILATEVGVWSTSNFSASSPSWTPSVSGLANVRVDMLQMRDSDLEVIAATHGRGLFSSNGFTNSVAPAVSMHYPGRVCQGADVQLSDSSTASPTSWTWTITPSTFSFVGSSTVNSQHPIVNFSAPGWYSLKLVVSNAAGADSTSITQAVYVGGYSLPFTEDFESASANEWELDNPDNADTWGLYTIAGNSPGNTAAGVANFSYNGAGQRDGLISPAVDLTGYSQISLDFEYAYRRYDASFQDSLAVYISTDCGSSWTKIGSYRETGSGNFVTGTDLTTSFTPTISGEWCGNSSNPACPSIDISGYAGNNQVKFKFENICGFGNNLFIDNINISGTTIVAPIADFQAASTTACAGDTISFTDLSTNGPTSWNWYFNPTTVGYANGTSSSSQHPDVIFNAAGTYEVILAASNSGGIDSAVKSTYITISPSLLPSVSISASDTIICAGDTVLFTATSLNQGSSPIYQWKKNGLNVGSNSPVFETFNLAHGDAVSVELTSSEACASPATVNATGIAIIVNPLLNPTISITAQNTSLCSLDTAHFSATISGGGLSPFIQWKVNGVNVGTNSTSFSSSFLSNGDVVSAELISSGCSNGPANSNSISMNISSAITPTVSISTSDTTICDSATATFQALVSGGGSAPVYQWKLNGANVGANVPTYTAQNLSNNDQVSLEITSSLSCSSPSTVTSAPISMTVVPGPQINITSVVPPALCSGDTLELLAAASGSGGPGTGTWSGPGIVNGNKFVASAVNNGSHTLTYNYAYMFGAACMSSKSLNVVVENIPNPIIQRIGAQLNCPQSGYNYQWYFNGVPIPGAKSATYTPTANGNYSLELSLSFCSNISNAINIQNVGVEEWKQIFGFLAYPNPSNKSLTFEFNNPGEGHIVYDLISFNGAIVQHGNIEAQGVVRHTLNLQQLATGLYTLRVRAGSITFTEKINRE